MSILSSTNIGKYAQVNQQNTDLTKEGFVPMFGSTYYFGKYSTSNHKHIFIDGRGRFVYAFYGIRWADTTTYCWIDNRYKLDMVIQYFKDEFPNTKSKQKFFAQLKNVLLTNTITQNNNYWASFI